MVANPGGAKSPPRPADQARLDTISMGPPARTYLTTSPWISLTYIFDDEELDILKKGAVVMACHLCGQVNLTEFDPVLEKDILPDGHGHPFLRALRDQFEQEHQHEDKRR